MSDLFILAPGSVPRAAENPLPTVPATPGERFNLELDAALLGGNSNSQGRALFEEFERASSAFASVGIRVRNPYAREAPAEILGLDRSSREFFATPRLPTAQERRSELLAAWNAAAEQARAQFPERANEFRDVPDVHELMADRVRRAVTAARLAEEVGTGALGFAAGLAGGAAGALTDPLQIATLPIGAPMRLAGSLATRILTTAAIEAGIAGGVQLGVETMAAPFRQSVGLEARFGENVLAAAVGGAVLGGGLRGLIEGFYILRGGENPLVRPLGPPPRATPEEREAVALAEAQLHAREGNPGGPERAAQHAEALDRAAAELSVGQVPAIALPRAAARVPLVAAADPEVRLAELRRMQQQGPAYALDLGIIGDALAARIAADTGQQVAGFRHVMQSDEVRDVLRRHGEGGQDVRVRPVTLDDLARVPEIVASPSRVFHDGFSHQGLPVIVFERELPDGRIVVVEEVRASRERMAFKTMYFRSGRGGGPGTEVSPPGQGPPPPLRPKRGPRIAAQDISPTLLRFNVFTPPGRAVLVEPRVVELATLIPSHLEDGRLNPAYPHAEGIQPRDRSAAPSQDQVRNIAATLIPERLAPNVEAGLGAPIVADDLVVESGNGRVMALRQVFSREDLAEQREAYLAFLRAQGFDLTGFRNPVLVSARISALSPAERRAFVAEANGRTTAGQSAAERARGDADLAGRHIGLLRGADLRAEQNAPFVRAFMDGLTPEERRELMTDDKGLSAAGVRRIQEAILARAYGDELGALLDRFLEGSAPGLAGIAGALTDVAGAWARMRVAVAQGRMDAAADVTADLALAIRTIDDARRTGSTVRSRLAQDDFDAPPLPDAARALILTFLRSLDPNETERVLPRQAIAARLRGYLDGFAERQPGPDMFGVEASAADMLRGTRRSADAALPEGVMDEAVPLAGSERAGAPDATPAIPAADPDLGRRAAILDAVQRQPEITLPEREAAELTEARRIAAEANIAVPRALDDADVATANAPTIGARQLLDDADDAVAAAAEQAACLLGRVT